MSERVDVMGVLVDPWTQSETLDRIAEIIERRERPHQHVVVNAAKVVEANRDPELRQIINSCDIVNADGISVVWASRLLGRPVPERVTGIDLMEAVLDRAAERGWRVYFLGARPEVVSEVARRCQARWPALCVAGTRHGYWADEEEQAVADAVRDTAADVLLVAIPSPNKEVFLARHRERMGVPFVMGVGGSFDVVAGRTRRAPGWMQRVGLEWLWRLVQEPRRMLGRYVIGNGRFVGLLFGEYRRRPR